MELPEWLRKLLTPCAIDRYMNDVGGCRRMTALNGKRLLARAEPLSYSCAFDEAAVGLAAVARLVAAALLVQRHDDVLAPSAVEMLQPVDGAHEHASVAHLHVHKHNDHDGAGAYSPHVDGGLLTLVACPAADRCLVVQLPGGGEEHGRWSRAWRRCCRACRWAWTRSPVACPACRRVPGHVASRGQGDGRRPRPCQRHLPPAAAP